MKVTTNLQPVIGSFSPGMTVQIRMFIAALSSTKEKGPCFCCLLRLEGYLCWTPL